MRRKNVRYLAVGAGACLVAAFFGVSTAEAEAPLGPHRAIWSVRLDGEVAVDLGPLGAAMMDSPAAPLGVHIAVREIPGDAQTDILSGLADDAGAYAQLASHPRAAVAGAVDALLADALGRAAILAGFALVGLALLRMSGAPIVLSRRRIVAAALITTGWLVITVAPGARVTLPAGRTPEVLAGTDFAGIEVTGKLGDLLDVVGPRAVELYEQNEAFYNQAAGRVRGDFAAAAAVPAPRSGWDLQPPPAAREITTAVFVTDLHCNISMGRVVDALAAASGAELILNGGDTVVSGTEAEAFCVDAFAGEFRQPVIVADGNHDSAVTAGQERRAGWRVLSGAVVETAGLRVLGDSDSKATRLGSGTISVRAESAVETGARLGEEACAAGGVDVLLVHDPAVARSAMKSGCATLALSGHLHRQLGPTPLSGGAWRYVGSSAGGGNYGGRTIGPLQTPADLTVIRFHAGVPLQYSTVTVHPDGAVTVEPWTHFPSAG